MSDIFLELAYSPLFATGMALAALGVSFYVLYRQSFSVRKKKARVRTHTRTRGRKGKKAKMPRTIAGISVRDLTALGIVVLVVGVLLFAQLGARRLGMAENISLGFLYLTEQWNADDAADIAAIGSLPQGVDTFSEDIVRNDDITEATEAEVIIEAENDMTLPAAAISRESSPESEPEPEFTEPAIIPEPEPAAVLTPEPAPEPEVVEAEGPAPDITVSVGSPYGSTLEEGNILSFSAIISNKGAEEVQKSFNTQLFIDEFNDSIIDVYRKRIETNPLEISEQKTSTKIWRSAWTQKVGTHRAEVCADVDNVILESNEKNNCASVVFTVPGKEISGDLTVEQVIMVPSSPQSGTNVSFFGNIVNRGASKAGGSYVHIIVDGKLLTKNIRIPSLLSGAFESFESRTLWKALPGNHSYSICADGNEEVYETNEENNCAIGTFIVPEE